MASAEQNPIGWTAGRIPAGYPVPDSDDRATPSGVCGFTESTGASDVLARFTLNDSGDWDSAYYYAIEFGGWTGSNADAPQTSGASRIWSFRKSVSGNQTLTALIVAAGSAMFVVYSTTVSAPSVGGGSGRITVVAAFAGGSPPCSGTDVHLTGPNGYTDDEQTGSDGRVVISGLTPGTYAVTGGGAQAANPVVNGAGVATATVSVAAGSDQTVQFVCS